MHWKFTDSGLSVPSQEGVRGYRHIDKRYCPPLPNVGRLPFLLAPTIDDSKSTKTDAGSSLTLSSLTIGATANLLIVMVGSGNSGGTDIITACTVAGVSIFANILWNRSDSNFVRTKTFYQLNPTPGTPNIIASTSGFDQLAVLAVSIIGADVSGTPFGTAAVNSGSSATASVAVTSSSGLIIGGIMSDSEGGITEGGTLLTKTAAIAGDSIAGLQYYTTANPTVTWTQSNTGWAVGAVGVNAPGGASSPLFITGLDLNGLNVGGPFFGNPIG